MNKTKEELQAILNKHAAWRRGELEGARANLSRANLSRANLSGANLSRANLSRANLSGANLSRADLSRADLSGANLSGANLSGANLSRADLSGADLSGANLSGANLSRADLSGADLSGADLRYTRGLPENYLKKQQIVPEVGPFTAFKKLADGVVAQLEITGERVGGVCGRKCRASEAVVIGFFSTDAEPILDRTEAQSCYDRSFIYRIGETVKPTFSFDNSMIEECASGIHFFLTFGEASEFTL